jgi:Flp pilus assembly protein TadD
MGWLWLAAAAAGALALLAVLGMPRALWSLTGAALMLGATGYALQGSPSLAGKPAETTASQAAEDPGLIVLRDNMIGRYTLDGAYLIASDAMMARGDDKAAVQVLLGGIGKLPGSYALWTALGTAYAEHDGGQVSPAARFAFDQARRLAPNHPAPVFFAGLAYVRAGDLAASRRLWARALALSPPGIAYRDDIAFRLALLDRVLAMPGGAVAPR